MKLHPLLFGFIIISSVICFLPSCSDDSLTGHAEFHNFTDSKFEPHSADSILTKLNEDEKLDFFIELVRSSNSNNNEFDIWFANKKIALEKLNSSAREEKLYTFCKALYYSQLPNSKYNLAKQLELYAKKNNQYSLRGVALISLIEHHSERYKTDSLEFYLNELHSIAQQDSSKWLRTIYHKNKAYFHTLKSNYFEAILDYNLALNNLNEESQSLKGLIYHDLATAYYHLEWYDKAQVFIDSAIQIDGIEKHYKSRVNLAALIYSKNGDLVKAENLLLKIINEPDTYTSPLLLAQTYSNYGNLLRKMKKFDEALAYMSKSDSISSELGMEVGIIFNAINRAELYLDNQQFELALKEARALNVKLKEFNNPKLDESYYGILYKIYDAIGDEANANFYFRKYIENRNTHLGDLPRSLISEWELSQSRESALREKNLLELRLEQRDRAFYFVLFILSLSIMVFVLIFFIHSRRNLKIKNNAKLAQQQLAHDMELRSKELVSESLKNVSIQSTKEAIHKELMHLVNNLPENQQSQFNEFAKRVKGSGEDLVLDEFDKRFIGVYDAFYSRIQEIAQDITPNELRVCALIRLNCSTKEIAILMNRSVGRIENIRISIRKKLHLSSDDNLQQFLLQF